MNHYGLMIAKDDEDILEEVLRRNHAFFDAISVLDGTANNSKTGKIIKSFPNVEYYATDSQLPPEYSGKRDGIRGFLLEEIQRRHGFEGWITLLHSDEIFLDFNPRDAAEFADSRGCDMVEWKNVPFFLHTSQSGSYSYDPSKSVVDQVTWACFPGWPEMRQFKNKPGIRYNPKQHFRVYPEGLNNCFFTYNAIRHYAYRDPRSMRENAEDRVSRSWQSYGEWMNASSDVFVDILPGGFYKVAKDVRESVIRNGIDGVLSPRFDPKTHRGSVRNKIDLRTLGMRLGTFQKALDLFLQNGGSTIVETGTLRNSDTDAEGHSTLVLGEFCKIHGKRMWTVDIDPKNIEVARQATGDFKEYITYCVSDSVEFLKSFDQKIDLLYLDSMDCNPEGDATLSQTHNPNELKAAWDKLSRKAIILIDDSNHKNGGKSLLSKRFLAENGCVSILDEYQTLWLKS